MISNKNRREGEIKKKKIKKSENFFKVYEYIYI